MPGVVAGRRREQQRHRRSQQQGSAIVEFSLVLLPLLALIFLTLDLAWVLFAWASIQEGVREGVRFAITGQPDTSIAAIVQKYSFGIVNNAGNPSLVQIHYYSAANPAVEIPGTGSSCSGSIVKVVVTGISVTPIAPLWRSNLPIHLSGAAADLVESNSICR